MNTTKKVCFNKTECLWKLCNWSDVVEEQKDENTEMLNEKENFKNKLSAIIFPNMAFKNKRLWLQYLKNYLSI